MLMTDIVQIVVIWILCHSSVEVGPCKDVLKSKSLVNGPIPQKVPRTYHGILLVLDCFDGDFSKEVVMEERCWEM